VLEDPELELRERLVQYARRMLAVGLVAGTSGNLSARPPGSTWFVVTPSGLDYHLMRPEDAVIVDLEGKPLRRSMKPSVDTPIHAAIYRVRSDVGAVIHTHSPYAAAFSTLHREVPPVITESAGFLGGGVRVLEYVPPARPDTGERVAAGLGAERAVLLPNHGVVAVGEDLDKCYIAASQVEEMAHIAFLALQLGQPHLVPSAEIARMQGFIHRHYGQRTAPT
jgi:L-fuculose-phosphate aldolase